MAVTISDIARAVGVGTITVSRALRGEGYVSSEKKALILSKAKEMGYQRNDVARSLVLGRTRMIGFMVTFNLAALQTVVEPIERVLREAGYPVLLHSPSDTPEAQTMCLDQFLQNRVAGVIAFPGVSMNDIAPYQRLIDSGTKVVILDRPMENLQTPQIAVDNYRIARLATEHLVSLGHRNIVHLAMPEISEASHQRIRGYKDAMESAGITVTPSMIVPTDLTERDGAKAMTEILKRKNRPTAIVARHDLVAMGAMRAIYSAGLSIPEDISIVGTGNIWDTNVFRVRLTTVHYSTRWMARTGAKFLLEMLKGEDISPEIITLKARLLVRSSTAPLAHDC